MDMYTTVAVDDDEFMRKIVWSVAQRLTRPGKPAINVRVFRLACGHEGQAPYTLPKPEQVWCSLCQQREVASAKEK